MRSTINDKPVRGIAFPKLMVSSLTGGVYLMERAGCGTCIHEAALQGQPSARLGTRSTVLQEDFRDYEGTVHLANS